MGEDYKAVRIVLLLLQKPCCHHRGRICLRIKLTQREEGSPSSSDSKASACNAGDPGSILGLGRSPGEGNDNPLQYPGCYPLWYDYKELHLAATVLGLNLALLIPGCVTLAQKSLGPSSVTQGSWSRRPRTSQGCELLGHKYLQPTRLCPELGPWRRLNRPHPSGSCRESGWNREPKHE